MVINAKDAPRLVREHKRDSGTQARYLYTTDFSLSEEEIEVLHSDVKALGLLILDGGMAFRVTSRPSP